MGTGTAIDTYGLPMPFTIHDNYSILQFIAFVKSSNVICVFN